MPFRHDGALGPVIFTDVTTPSPTAAAILASSCDCTVRKLRGPGGTFRRNAEHTVTQRHRLRMFGDLLTDDRRPLTEHRAFGHPGCPAAVLCQGTGGRTQRLRIPAVPAPAPTTYGAGRQSGYDGPRATSRPDRHPCLGCGPRRAPPRGRDEPGPFPTDPRGGPVGTPQRRLRRTRAEWRRRQSSRTTEILPLSPSSRLIDTRRTSQSSGNVLCHSRSHQNLFGGCGHGGQRSAA